MQSGYMAKSKLAIARKRAGLTQQGLADAIGAHWTTISRLETGKLPLNYEWGLKLAAQLNVHWSELLDDVAGPTPITLSGKIFEQGARPIHFSMNDHANITLPKINRGTWYLFGDNSFFPQFKEGDIVHFSLMPLGTIEDLLGHFVLAIAPHTPPHDIFGTLARGKNPDKYCVRRPSAPDSDDFNPVLILRADVHYLKPPIPADFAPNVMREAWALESDPNYYSE